ncbi:MAG: DNA-binding domain-containing protein [Polyangiaceae bacterium]
MMRLAETQEQLTKTIRANVAVIDDPKSFKVAQMLATGNARMTPVDQLEVYREQFFLRHIGSFREDFPTLELLLGGAKFDELCRAYLKELPPASFALRDASDRLALFLESAAPYKDDALLADCAKIEWAFIEAFDAADAPPLDVSALAAIDEDAWDRAKIQFHPSLRFSSLRYPAHTFRTAVRGNEKPARPEKHPACVVTFRGADGVLRWLEVAPAAHTLLVALLNGQPLGVAGEAGAALDADIGEKIGGWFQMWTANGWIAKIVVAET